LAKSDAPIAGKRCPFCKRSARFSVPEFRHANALLESNFTLQHEMLCASKCASDFEVLAFVVIGRQLFDERKISVLPM
jgi:hypothetical protein